VHVLVFYPLQVLGIYCKVNFNDVSGNTVLGLQSRCVRSEICRCLASILYFLAGGRTSLIERALSSVRQ